MRGASLVARNGGACLGPRNLIMDLALNDVLADATFDR